MPLQGQKRIPSSDRDGPRAHSGTQFISAARHRTSRTIDPTSPLGALGVIELKLMKYKKERRREKKIEKINFRQSKASSNVKVSCPKPMKPALRLAHPDLNKHGDAGQGGIGGGSGDSGTHSTRPPPWGWRQSKRKQRCSVTGSGVG